MYIYIQFAVTFVGSNLDYNLMSGNNPLAGCNRNFATGTGGDITSRDIMLDVFPMIISTLEATVAS